MQNEYYGLVARAGEAAHQTQCADRGVCVSVDHIGNERYEFVIWAVVARRIIRHRLLCEVTPLERLIAHVSGFSPA